jgi:urate oxidase
MATLGDNRYGKAGIRLVGVTRDGPRHEIRDLTVATSLQGDFAAAHLVGDQSAVLPTDTQKNTVYALAREHGVGAVEEFALVLARHFVEDVAPVTAARVRVSEQQWDRAVVDGAEHDHTFVRAGQESRTTEVTVSDRGTVVVSGVEDLVLLKSTGSEFHGFLVDEYTTLQPTHDRILATSLRARWRYRDRPADFDTAYDRLRALLVSRFGAVHSLALQQTLWEMGRALVDDSEAGVEQVDLVAPNKHHFLVDLTPFGLDNPGEVFVATEAPYGLIEVSVHA